MNSLVNAGVSSVELSVVQKEVKKMGGRKVSDEGKAEAIRRVCEDGERVADVASDFGVSDSAVHGWVSVHRRELEIERRYEGLIERCSQLEEMCKEKDKTIVHLEVKVSVLEEMHDKAIRKSLQAGEEKNKTDK